MATNRNYKIAEELSISAWTVSRYLKLNNIPRRTRSEYVKLVMQDENSGNYKGGFRKCKCGNLLRNYQKRVKMCRECYREFMKNPRNNPNFGRIFKSIRRAYYYNKVCMRSSWEVLYAKYLDSNNLEWFYESKTFDLGDCTYTPDFYIPKYNLYIEIKGWFHGKTKEKFEKFEVLYPEINIELLMEKDLKILGIL